MTVSGAERGAEPVAARRVVLVETLPRPGQHRRGVAQLDTVNGPTLEQRVQPALRHRGEVRGHERVGDDRQAALIVDGVEGVLDRHVHAHLSFLNAIPPEQRPGWWTDLCGEVLSRADSPIGEDYDEVGWYATMLMPDLIMDAPGMKFSLSLLGSNNMIGAGNSWFVWSQNPTVATQEISKRISTATGVVHSAVRTVAEVPPPQTTRGELSV
jgi:hypothetical protein